MKLEDSNQEHKEIGDIVNMAEQSIASDDSIGKNPTCLCSNNYENWTKN